MKIFLTLFLIFTSILVLGQDNSKDSLWTYQDDKNYAIKNLDSTKWDLKKLDVDLRGVKHYVLQAGIRDYPSPVLEYSGNGSIIMPLSYQLGGKTLTGYTLGHVEDKYRKDLFVSDTLGYDYPYHAFFTILFVTDKPKQDVDGNPLVTSRNYPHYLFTGTQNTSLGNIDWLQMTHANGDNFAIVTQRYFDLSQGQTILVAPLNDGTVRLLQVKMSPKLIVPQLGYAAPSLLEFEKKLLSSKQVKDFFNQRNILTEKK